MGNDVRIPVRLGTVDAPGEVAEDALAVAPAGLALGPALIRLDLPPPAAAGPGHGIACACCRPRGGLPVLLADAFQRRARGSMPFFTSVHVVARPGERAAIEAALHEDRVLAARFRVVAAEVSAQ